MELIEGVDYCFIYPKDDGTAVHVKLLTGPYKDTVFRFGKVKFEERHGNVYLLFAYYVLESTVDKPKNLEKSTEFRDYVGPLLVQLMSGNLEEDIIDETGTDDSSESNLQ
jgi:hypothetical protein